LSGGSSHAVEAGWYVEAGDYTLNIAHSVGDVAFAETFTVSEPLGPLQNEATLP